MLHILYTELAEVPPSMMYLIIIVSEPDEVTYSTQAKQSVIKPFWMLTFPRIN